jgi:type IV pilus assembly protein PilO
LLAGIGAIAALYLFHAYWYTPRIVEIESLQTRLTDLQDKNRQAQVTAARAGTDLEERLAIYERHMVRLEELIPGQEEVSSLLNSISLEARRSGVEISTLNPGAIQTEAFYTRQAFDMAVWGDYHNVGRFLTAVASLPRIVTPKNLSIAPFPEGEGRSGMVAPIIARFFIETYVLPSDPGAIPASDAQGGA